MNTDLDDLRVIDHQTAADIIGVSRAHLGDLTRAGQIGHVVIGKGTKRNRYGYLRRHIEEFLASREVGGLASARLLDQCWITLARATAWLTPEQSEAFTDRLTAPSISRADAEAFISDIAASREGERDA